MQVKSLRRQAQHGVVGGNGVGRGASERREAADEDGTGGGGDPLREAFNRLGSVIDFQAQQQARVGVGGYCMHIARLIPGLRFCRAAGMFFFCVLGGFKRTVLRV